MAFQGCGQRRHSPVCSEMFQLQGVQEAWSIRETAQTKDLRRQELEFRPCSVLAKERTSLLLGLNCTIYKI